MLLIELESFNCGHLGREKIQHFSIETQPGHPDGH